MKTRFSSIFLALPLLASALPAMAQSGSGLSISLSTIDGGGGPSSGGSFSLNGTIGQFDAGTPLSGSVFSVNGGFWPGVTGGSIEPTPGLAIRLGTPMAGVNTVILYWPSPSTGYVLQLSANMQAPGGGWVDVTQPSVIVGPNQEVTLPATGRFCMFRLRRL